VIVGAIIWREAIRERLQKSGSKNMKASLLGEGGVGESVRKKNSSENGK